jgi:hypothetical protein
VAVYAYGYPTRKGIPDPYGWTMTAFRASLRRLLGRVECIGGCLGLGEIPARGSEDPTVTPRFWSRPKALASFFSGWERRNRGPGRARLHRACERLSDLHALGDDPQIEGGREVRGTDDGRRLPRVPPDREATNER